MKLHLNNKLFKEAIVAGAQNIGIPTIYIEKDYWVTYALYTIFNSEASAYAVFKGGTALSKCYGIIERFSEDIDLVVLKEKSESGNSLKNKLRTLSKAIENTLPEIEVVGITNKRGMIRKTAHSYSKQFEGDYGQVRDFLVLESTWLGYHEPHTQKQISTYIHQMMVKTGQEDIAKEYELLPFDIRVLETTRTICEKIMSLVRFSHSENPTEDLKLKIRHLYDLHQLLSIDVLSTFLDSPDFEIMLNKVGQDDIEGYRTGNEWLIHHPKQAILFSEVDKTWSEIKEVYKGNFSDLVYGTLPKEDEILDTIKRISNRLESIKWSITPID